MNFGGLFGKTIPATATSVPMSDVLDVSTTVMPDVIGNVTNATAEACTSNVVDSAVDIALEIVNKTEASTSTAFVAEVAPSVEVEKISIASVTLADLIQDPLKFMTNDVLWYTLLISLSFFFACGLGYAMVEGLRRTYRTYNKIQTLALIPLMSPVLVFVGLNFLAALGLVDLVIADSFTFGLLIGTVYTLSLKPTGKFTQKLIVNQLTGPSVEVWLDSNKTKIGDVRQIIASEGLKIAPASRVSIESGKGRPLEDMSIDFNTIKQGECTDFFGFSVCSCYVTIKEAEPEPDNALESIEGTYLKKKKSNFMSLLNTKGEAKFGVELSIIAKVPTVRNSAAPFYVSSVDMFAAAAPSQATPTMRFVKWDTAQDSSDKGEPSDEWEASSLGSPRQKGPPASANRAANGAPMTGSTVSSVATNSIDLRASGQPIRHGDEIVLECEGKYMAVARGWWLKWGSTVPRRSGAFTVEIVEKAPQNVLTNQLKDFGRDIGDTLKETFERMDVLKMGDQYKSQSAAGGVGHGHGHGHGVGGGQGGARVDVSVGRVGDHIRTGDAFRLRSVKFPDYELGITNVKIRDEFTYLGLRKIGDTMSAGSDNWCQEVWFYVKLNSMSTELFKLPK